jgi:hypothetical protein
MSIKARIKRLDDVTRRMIPPDPTEQWRAILLGAAKVYGDQADINAVIAMSDEEVREDFAGMDETITLVFATPALPDDDDELGAIVATGGNFSQN